LDALHVARQSRCLKPKST